jgi:hypothetical protein
MTTTQSAATYTAVVYSAQDPKRETVRRGGFTSQAKATAWAVDNFPGRPRRIISPEQARTDAGTLVVQLQSQPVETLVALADEIGEDAQEQENRTVAAWSMKVSQALRLLAEAHELRDTL